MKKIILPALLLGAVLSMAPAQDAAAQIRNDRGTFHLPTKGDILFETQANLDLSGGPVFSLRDDFNNFLMADSMSIASFPMLKMRYFGSNNLVHRFLFNLSYGSNAVGESKTSVFGISAGYGIEKIFTPAERLNTYVGADIMVGYARIGEEFDGTDLGNINTFGIGARVFTGMDYYVLPKVYLGFELGYGLGYRNTEVEVTGLGSSDAISSVGFAPFVTPSFRLGYVLGWSKRARGNGEPSYRSRDSYEYEDD